MSGPRRVVAVMAISKRDGIALRMHVRAYSGAAKPGHRTIETPAGKQVGR